MTTHDVKRNTALQWFRGIQQGDDLRARLIKGASGSFGLKVSAVGLAFATSLLLTRTLGAAGYGSYVYAIAWVKLLVIPAVFGLDRLLTREVAIYLARSDWPLMRGLLGWANRLGLIASLGLTAIAFALGTWVLDLDPTSRLAFQIATILLPVVTLTRLRQGTLNGLHKVVQSQLPEMFVQPLLIIILCGGAYFVLRDRFSAPLVTGIHVAAGIVAFAIGMLLLHRQLPTIVKKVKPTYTRRLWMASVGPLVIVSGLQVINIRMDTIMLGILQEPEAVGIYAMVTRGAEFISFPLLAVNAVLGPTIARSFAKDNLQALQKAITKSVRIALLAALPIGLGLIVFGNWFLLLFGEEFTVGHTALIILSVASLFNVSMGAVAIILTMTGHERAVAVGVGSGAILNVILNALLIPYFSINGAAIATASGMLLWNIILVFLVYKRLRIHPTVLGKLSRG